MSPAEQYEQVAQAFSRQAPNYDAEETHNKVLRVMRQQVRALVMGLLAPGAHILELNAGTGMDAVYFARQGMKITATDLSPGMVKEMERKVKAESLEGNISVVQAGFLELNEKLDGGYDFVFSNMGGLNCQPDLGAVFRQLAPLMKPGGQALLVIMPPICPWELLTVIKGKWGHAFRRWGKGGINAKVEGVPFRTYYYSRADIKRSLPEGWQLQRTIGLAALLPQPHMAEFTERHPFLFRILQQMDAKLRHIYPFNRWADHIIVQLRLGKS